MMRARWIQLAGAWQAAASLRSRRSSAGSVGGRACRSAGMASPRCRYGHDHGTPSVTLIPDLRNAALDGSPTNAFSAMAAMAFRASDRATPLDLVRDLGSNTSINHLPPHQDLELLLQRRRDHDRWRLPGVGRLGAPARAVCAPRPPSTRTPKVQPSRPAPRTS